MSVIESMMETIAKALPDKKVDPLIQHQDYVGQPLDRVDAQAKVQGEARFTAEFQIENMAYAVPVYSTIAKGKIRKIDSGTAEQAPGVLAVITHQNIPRMKAPPIVDFHNIGKGFALSDLPIMQNAEVHWDGEPVAIVVAETLEKAEHAASLVSVEYEVETPDVSFEDAKAGAFVPKDILGEPPEIKIGDGNQAFAEADVSVGHVYRTPRYNHNAIEPHATIAVWDEKRRGSGVRCHAIRKSDRAYAGLYFRPQSGRCSGGRPVPRRRLRREDRLEQYCALRGGRKGGKSSRKDGVVARRDFSNDRRPHAVRTACRSGSAEGRQADGSGTYGADGNHSKRALRRAVHVSAAASLFVAESLCGAEGGVSGHCRQHVDARSGRIDRHVRSRIGHGRTRP